MSWLIWSNEHGAWWKPGRNGYTRELAQAGRYGKAEADEIVAQANQYCEPGICNEVAMLDPFTTAADAKL
jgi:hypothetical protein